MADQLLFDVILALGVGLGAGIVMGLLLRSMGQ